MSDVIPTDEDERTAKTILTDDKGNYSSEKIALETARHRRVLMQTTAEVQKVKRCLNGDEATGYPGMRKRLEDNTNLAEKTHTMVCEMYERNTGKKPHTDTHALERKPDLFVERLKGAILFIAWFITTLLALFAIVW